MFYCLRLEIPLVWRGRFPYLYPPGTGLTSYTPRHWVHFSSPPSTQRSAVEVFDPASTRGYVHQTPQQAATTRTTTTTELCNV
jgi:hypothetical protein